VSHKKFLKNTKRNYKIKKISRDFQISHQFLKVKLLELINSKQMIIRAI